MAQQPVPSWLAASWERLWVINGASGPPTNTVNVRNIQTPTLFGDCRIPKDRPRYPKAKSLEDLSDKELETLYPQEGFSGNTTVEGYLVTWHHEITYHDKQRLHEILSVAGDHYIYARNRSFDLPMADSLAALIKKEKYKRKQIIEILNMEVSHGFVLGGRVPWEVQFSTLPYKEEKPLDFASEIMVDPKTGKLAAKKPSPDLLWSFPINTLAEQDLLVLFPPAKAK